MSTAAFETALMELRTRRGRAGVHLETAPGARGEEILVYSPHHAFFVPTHGAYVRAVPRHEVRRLALCHRVALVAGCAMLICWLLAGLVLFTGAPLIPLFLGGGASAWLFMASILVTTVITSRPERVGSDDPLAAEAAAAMTRAVSPEALVESGARPRSWSHTSGTPAEASGAFPMNASST